jgi:hypothetical protein|uniref:Uncharacterized protein n=1 Tax=viral metagenome TaxID=1070528 RepID=A0A6C0AVM3_9ZZZZ|tara:strand:- start:849 stop:1616 length:768 start_codon:yes stop_codon:yes gene_type:complete
MVNLLAVAILIVLIVTYCCFTKQAISESFTNKKRIGHLDFKDTNNTGSITLENFDDSGDSSSSSESSSESDNDEEIATNESRVDDTIILKDTMRRNSKVPSSLNFTYIDETCGSVVKETQPDFPIEKVKAEPVTPIVNINNTLPSWEKSACKVSGPSNNSTNQKFQNEKQFHSEIFDDSELKPKPQIDSPYGFVYFPNKYWNQWHKKPPVCTPTDKCKVIPTYTQGTPVDVLDYTQLGSLMPKFEYQEEYENSCK